MTTDGGSLVGRRVVVTRVADRADALAELLTAAGAVPVVVPLIEIVPEPAGVDALAGALAGDGETGVFDWLVVTSPNAALAVLEQTAAVLPGRVAAIGSVSAAVLAERGIAPTLVPERQRAEGLVEVFPTAPTERPGRVLVVQAVDGAATLVEGLRAKGWEVVVVRPYRSVSSRPSDDARAAALDADAVLFASGSAARGWAAVFGTHTPPVVVAIGPETAAATERAGLQVTVVADDHSLAGLVDALDRLFRAQ